jgi:hypothetical protein
LGPLKSGALGKCLPCLWVKTALPPCDIWWHGFWLTSPPPCDIKDQGTNLKCFSYEIIFFDEFWIGSKIAMAIKIKEKENFKEVNFSKIFAIFASKMRYREFSFDDFYGNIAFSFKIITRSM